MMADGLTLKAEGQARAIDAKSEWRERARSLIAAFAATRRPFTSEDVIDVIGLPSGDVGNNRNNAVGAVMTGAARRRVIYKTGRRVPARRPSSHGAELTEWIGI